jgi:hypothetical protein
MQNLDWDDFAAANGDGNGIAERIAAMPMAQIEDSSP